MTAYASDYFRMISDGHKIILLRKSNSGRECIEIIDPVLCSWNMNIHRELIDVTSWGSDYTEKIAGLMSLTVDLSFSGGSVIYREKPLIMGVDIFDKLSISDYLDIINEKIKLQK